MNFPNPIRSLKRRRRTKRDAAKETAKEAAPKALLVAAGAALAGLARFFDKRRRRAARDRAASAVSSGAEAAAGKAAHAANVARGAAHEATPSGGETEYDDVTLARKVESEIFRPADAPKGDVDVNVHDGIVELRGTVDSEEKSSELAAAAEKVDGVNEVHNLLNVGGAGSG